MKRMLIVMLLFVLVRNAAITDEKNKGTNERKSIQASTNMWVNAYYPEFGDVSPTPEQIDFTAFTQITIFTTEATQNGPYYFRELPGSADSSYFDGGYNHRLVNGQNWRTRIVNLAHAAGVKVIMCLGGEVGGNANNFSYMIADPARRAAYISYVTGFAHRRNIDGYDVDHEFTAGGEAGNLKAFFTELRAADPGAVITTAVPLWASAAYYNEAAFYNGNTVDQINIMAYREADGSSIVGFNSPLFQPKNAYPNYNGGSWFNNNFGQGPYLGWVNKGINKNKIGMIIPFEMAHIAGNDAPGQSRSGWVQFANYSSVVAAKNNNPGSDHWDNEAKVPWVGYTDGSGKHFYSYENQASIQAKVDTLRNGGFGGIGIWELFRGYASNANPPDELLQDLKMALGGITPPPLDTQNPTITMVTPADGDAISGLKIVSANASDNVGVSRVEFIIDGSTAATVFSPPYNYSWNASALTGSHTVQAKAYDAANNVGSTPVVNVTVTAPPPDVTNPTVSITSPPDGSTVADAVTISLNASDNIGVTRVDFQVDGSVLFTDLTSPFNYVWDASTVTGNHTISAIAYDAAGNVGNSATFVVNVVPPPPAAVDPWLYQDTLLAPWRDSSWNSNNSYTSTEQVYAGVHSLKATQTPWGAASFRSGFSGSGGHVDPALYSRFEFAIYNTTPNLILDVFCYNDLGETFPDVLQNSVPVNQWTIISVPMYQLNPNGQMIDRVNIQNYTRLNPVYYVDNIHFVNATLDVQPSTVPMTYALEQNYPNPFNPSTTIRFSLPEEGKVTLKLYDVLGQELRTIISNQEYQQGAYQVDFSAGDLSSGVYLYRLTTGDGKFQSFRKMVIMK